MRGELKNWKTKKLMKNPFFKSEANTGSIPMIQENSNEFIWVVSYSAKS